MRIFLILISAVIFLTGCQTTVENNYRKPIDLADHLVACGIAVDQVQRLSPKPFMASDALTITVAGEEIGVYKFNTDVRVQKERLERYKENGRAFIIGIPFPIVIQGSFMVLGTEKNPKKKEIIEAIKSFE